MDREEDELQFLGIFGIYKESFKIVYKWRKIFSQISLTLILPLSFILLAHTEVSDIFEKRIRRLENETRQYSSDPTTKEWVNYWLIFKAVYVTSMVIFGLLSTSTVVYTIACVYTAQEITFRKIMRVVPRVWKRVMITFLCNFQVFMLYKLVATVPLLYSNGGDGHSFNIFGIFSFSFEKGLTGIFLLILYAVGSVYMTIIWQLASVVSVWEETKGIKALIKSKKLLRGNMRVVSIIFFKIIALAYVIQFSIQALVVDGCLFGMKGRIGFGVLFLLLLLKLILFLLVIQTVIYFVCKSYHHENIDTYSALSDHLKVIHLGDYYVPLQ